MNQGAISADGWMRSYLPNVVAAYIVEIEGSTEHHSMIYNGTRSKQLSPIFLMKRRGSWAGEESCGRALNSS
jgi:hypothetical protein